MGSHPPLYWQGSQESVATADVVLSPGRFCLGDKPRMPRRGTRLPTARRTSAPRSRRICPAHLPQPRGPDHEGPRRALGRFCGRGRLRLRVSSLQGGMLDSVSRYNAHRGAPRRCASRLIGDDPRMRARVEVLRAGLAACVCVCVCVRVWAGGTEVQAPPSCSASVSSVSCCSCSFLVPAGDPWGIEPSSVFVSGHVRVAGRARAPSVVHV